MANNLISSQQRVFTAGTASNSLFNITTPTVVKAAPGYVTRVIVQVAGSGTGTVNDCATTGAAAIGNQIDVIPQTVGSLPIEWPCMTGIVIVPGTGQTVAVSFA